MNIKQIKTNDDIKKIISLFIHIFSEKPYTETWTEKQAFERINEIFQKGKEYCYFIEDENKPLGIILCQTQTWEDGTHLIIEDCLVDSSQRNKGIGKILLKHIENIAQKNKIVSIDLLSHKDSQALLFWEHQGFKQNGFVQLKKIL